MARARSIKPSFFKNDELAECEPMARLLFVGLWTLADRDGRLECRPMRIKAELFPYDNCDMGELLAQLQKRGFIEIYESEGVSVLQIPKFAEHQRCHPEERSESLPARAKHETGKFPGEPGNNPAICASFLLPSSPFPFPISSSAPSSAAPRLGSEPADAIRWDAVAGWGGIGDADHAEWLLAYPAADIKTELARAHQWLKANPKKAKKSNWRRWLTTTWLTKCQDRGGTNREASRSGAPPPTDTARRRFYRSDSQRSQTDAEHAEWCKSQAREAISSR